MKEEPTSLYMDLPRGTKHLPRGSSTSTRRVNGNRAFSIDFCVGMFLSAAAEVARLTNATTPRLLISRLVQRHSPRYE